MHKFRKKPVVIEAFQMTEARRRDNSDWPEWLHRAWNYGENDIGGVSSRDYPKSDGTDPLVINTLEGVMSVSWNDWIIKGVNGELYPCKPYIFAASYESVGAHCSHVMGACSKCEEKNPELLEACEDMLKAIEYAGTRLVGKEFEAKEKIIQAVRKARGE